MDEKEAEARPEMGTFFLVNIYMSVCRMSVVCQINCVGGITYGPRACSKSFLAVKPVTPALFISSFSMDEKEAEARPIMGTIFLVVQSRFRCCRYVVCLSYVKLTA